MVELLYVLLYLQCFLCCFTFELIMDEVTNNIYAVSGIEQNLVRSLCFKATNQESKDLSDKLLIIPQEKQLNMLLQKQYQSRISQLMHFAITTYPLLSLHNHSNNKKSQLRKSIIIIVLTHSKINKISLNHIVKVLQYFLHKFPLLLILILGLFLS